MRVLSNQISHYEGKQIELAGWVNCRRDHGKLIFIDLRDKEGLTQVVFTPQDKELHKKADSLRQEWVIKIKGIVQKRPKGMENSDIPSGSYEVPAEELEIFAKAETPAFDLTNDGIEIGEDIRMKYRYLDLRRPRLQNNLRMRAKINKFIRDFLGEKNFTEVETPYLSKSTPEGARDYLVPSRLYPGKFYALPQSPQQYKQLLMLAGLERYFQIVRCFRDEDTRGDRQPEFTQLDIEMSFIAQEDILELTEELYLGLARTLYPHKKIRLAQDGRIPRMTYKKAIEDYNSDRPDVRDDKNNPDELAFLFVLDFPMFEWKAKENRWDAMHHPFTQPQVKSLDDFNKEFEKNPSAILAFQYDFVLNGYEIGGGSIRIHEPELLARIFEAMGNKREDINKKFGHILEAFKYGVPPHGGIAFGLDRFVSIVQNEPNIREVIAFPKTGDARDLMMDSPSEVEEGQLKELHLIKNQKSNSLR